MKKEIDAVIVYYSSSTLFLIFHLFESDKINFLNELLAGTQSIDLFDYPRTVTFSKLILFVKLLFL